MLQLPNDKTIELLLWGLGLFGTGGITCGLLARFLLQRLVKQYDEKHKESASHALDIKEKMGQISQDIAVIKVLFGGFEPLKKQVMEDHDKVVAMGVKLKDANTDIHAQHSKIRACEEKCDEAKQLISTFRRLNSDEQ